MFRSHYKQATAAVQPDENLIQNTKETMEFEFNNLQFSAADTKPDQGTYSTSSALFHLNQEFIRQYVIFLFFLAACIGIIVFGINSSISHETATPKYGASFIATPAKNHAYINTAQNTKESAPLSNDLSNNNTAME